MLEIYDKIGVNIHYNTYFCYFYICTVINNKFTFYFGRIQLLSLDDLTIAKSSKEIHTIYIYIKSFNDYDMSVCDT